MRIATYNIWNSADNRIQRRDALCEELTRIDADLVALQEVPLRADDDDLRDMAQFVSEQTVYPYAAFRKYPCDDEGLAFLSKSPFLSVEAGWETSIEALRECGLRVEINLSGMDIAFTNVHLDYQSIAVREAQIVGMSEWIASRSERGCLEVLCGDFNCCPESSVYRFLMGQQTLLGQVGAVWHDLAAYCASRTGTPPLPTLDFSTNPRWADEVSLSLPARFDWILLQECWPLPSPRVTHVELFGRHSVSQTGVVPSDHYGVLADISSIRTACL